MKAIVAGASGEVGKTLMQLLIEDADISMITILGRKKLEYSSPKITSLIVDFEHINSISLLDGDIVFCCLGTTIKKAKTQANFMKVDKTYVSDLGRWAIKSNIKQFHVVSALGANAHSKIFYNRIKGEMENEIKSLPFLSTYVYRPALLDSERTESRPAERLSIYLFRFINPILFGPFKKYRSINVKKVAQGMLLRSKLSKPGIHFISSDKI